MNKLYLIIRREYLSRVRKKSFLIMTIITPFIMSAIFVLPILISQNDESSRSLAIIDENSLVDNFFDDSKNIEFDTFNNSQSYSAAFLDQYDAILVVPKSLDQTFEIHSSQQISLSLQQDITNVLEKNITLINLEKNGINPNLINQSEAKINLQTKLIDSNGKEILSSSELSLVIAMLSGFLIYFFIFMYGAMVMRGVIEEKTNRIIEVMISSVKPFQLMIGKIIGIALVGLTQFFFWLIIAAIGISLAPFLMESSSLIQNEINTVNSPINSLEIFNNLPIYSLVFGFVFYFIAGYFLYGSLFASVGAAVDHETDSQQFMLPLTLPLILSFIMIQPIIDNPHGDLAYWFSMIPFTSPIIMMVRIPFGVPIFELALSMTILVIGIVSSIWLSSKIYRVGILMYGKKPSYKEVWKWIKYKG
ncbi:MAG: ABC transporter permease [Flavobacteriales bacterium]|tara:strand:- start:13181 stop:14437 length:1257 start_codon:yes stop_codon:yes gene_type:complete